MSLWKTDMCGIGYIAFHLAAISGLRWSRTCMLSVTGEIRDV
jgi:hypothetical protein